jgi:hypothetical protein
MPALARSDAPEAPRDPVVIAEAQTWRGGASLG